MNLLEICTSDTHYSSVVVRNRTGYYQFGKVTKAQDIADWYLKIAKDAEKNLSPASFDILEHKADVKVMGTTMFEDISRALDRCMLLSKGFMVGSFALFIASLFL
jgi:putative membrane protein